jgi:hypothetical protein
MSERYAVATDSRALERCWAALPVQSLSLEDLFPVYLHAPWRFDAKFHHPPVDGENSHADALIDADGLTLTSR